jgi:hypothetical protein
MVTYNEDSWRLCWRHGTVFPLCAITASIAAISSPIGTAIKYPSKIFLLLGSGVLLALTIEKYLGTFPSLIVPSINESRSEGFVFVNEM